MRRPPTWALLLAGTLALVATAVWHRYFVTVTWIDLHVYWHAAGELAGGRDVYEGVDPTNGWPFTYPPVAAVLFLPFAWLPFDVLGAVWTLVGVAALAGVVHLGLTRFERYADLPPAASYALVGVVTLAATGLAPVRDNAHFGQVNLVLMLLVMIDLLRPERRTAGLLLGIAAGVKLTPLFFLALLVLTGRWRVAATAVAGFLATVAVGFAVMPRSAWRYWTEEVVSTERIGGEMGFHRVSNQSWQGLLYRLTGEPPSTLLWVAVAAPVALALVWLAARLWRQGYDDLAVGVAAVGMLAASPISWRHHWVWTVPLVIAYVRWTLARREASRTSGDGDAAPSLWPDWAALAVFCALFTPGLIYWAPHDDGLEFTWTFGEGLLGNAYLLAGLALTAWIGARVARARHM